MQNSNDLPMEWIERIFMRLHGRFGNQFHDKFKTGQLIKETKEDVGIVNAKLTWGSELAGISPDRIKTALMANYDYPPSCDEFKKNCVTARFEPPIYTALPAPNNKETNKVYADNVVKFVAAHTVDKTDYKAWAKRILANPQNFPDSSSIAAKEAMGTA